MKITDIRIRMVDASGKLRAVASVTFDDMFVVHDMKIIEGVGGLFIAMPSRRTPNGTFKDVAHPTNSEARAWIQNSVLDAYCQLAQEDPATVTEAIVRTGVQVVEEAEVLPGSEDM